MANLPSYKRAADPPPMCLTSRDAEIVAAVYVYRFLNSHQIEALFFPSKTDRGSRKQACQRRLQLLYHHGFLARLPVPVVLGEGRAPIVYALDEKGANLVASKLGIDRPQIVWKPANNRITPLFLDHTLAINNIRIMVSRLAQEKTFELVSWMDENQLKSPEWKGKVPYRMAGTRINRIFPDGYFSLQLPTATVPAHFFFEIDQATMSNTRWREKIQAYVYYRQSGQAQKHFKTQRFRVLTVTTTPNRLANLKRTTEKAGGDHFFWFSTQDQLTIWQPHQFLAPHWQIATQEGGFPLF